MPTTAPFRVANLDNMIRDAKANDVVSRTEAGDIAAYAQTATHPSSRTAAIDRLTKLQASPMVRDSRAASKISQTAARLSGNGTAVRCGQVGKAKVFSDAQMLRRLAEVLPDVATATLNTLRGDEAKMAMLRKTDLSGSGTLFDHILATATAKPNEQLLDGPALAAELLRALTEGDRTKAGGYCYSVSLFVSWLKKEPAEIARVIGELGSKGKTILASGHIVKWNQSGTRLYPSNAISKLWGGIVTQARLPRTANPLVLSNLDGAYANKGQMANVLTRMYGIEHINVKVDYNAYGHDSNTLERARKIWNIAQNGGTVLAEYGGHGGTADDFQPTQGFFDGPRNNWRASVGYMAVPRAEAKKAGLAVMDLSPYVDAEQYVNPASLKLRG